MKDIKSLYQNAKFSKSDKAIAAYNEAVTNVFNTDPLGYVLQLEYIISSSIGAETFIPFVETYGLPISMYEKAKECIENCKSKLKKQNKNDQVYDDVDKYLEFFHKRYAKCIAMNEYLVDDVDKHYIESYYSDVNGHQGRTLIKGMYERYGNQSIMDSIITADNINSIDTAVKYFSRVTDDSNICEAVMFATTDMNVDNSIYEYVSSKASSTIVANLQNRNNKIFRESVITGNTDMYYEYNENEISAIESLISFKEFCLCCDDIGININECHNDILTLYEELDGIVEEDGADIIGMLPQMQTGTESIFKPISNYALMNTRDKKTGSAPTYLSRNHDMINYGETDGASDNDTSIDQKKVKSLEDYKLKLPNTSNDTSNVNGIDPDEDDNTSTSKHVTDKEDDNDNISRGGNNYYYYTYTNSMNRNNNSFNKDNSSHDDHSVYNTHDDHSHNKRIRSNNYNNDDADSYDDIKESLNNPWELNISLDSIFTEAIGDADDMKPESDHPIKDAFQDIDRATIKVHQNIKKGVQDVQNVGRAIMKPVNRAKNWIGKMIGDFKDASETNIKEKMADPKARWNLFSVIKQAIKVGALAKAGILFNPIFLFLAATKHGITNAKTKRIRNEMIGEIKNEIEIIKVKIADCESGFGENDPIKKENKYKLMRLKNELEKKLLRVQGGKQWAKII